MRTSIRLKHLPRFEREGYKVLRRKYWKLRKKGKGSFDEVLEITLGMTWILNKKRLADA